MGMKVIIDWVPNHTGGDNRWLTEHPDFFVKDSSGQSRRSQGLGGYPAAGLSKSGYGRQYDCLHEILACQIQY